MLLLRVSWGRVTELPQQPRQNELGESGGPRYPAVPVVTTAPVLARQPQLPLSRDEWRWSPTSPPTAAPSLPHALPRRPGPGAGPAAGGEGSPQLQLSAIPTHPALTGGHYLQPPRPLPSSPSLPVALSPRLSITLQHGLFHYFNRGRDAERSLGGRLGGPREGSVVTVDPRFSAASLNLKAVSQPHSSFCTRSSPCIQVGRVEDGAGD